MPMKTFFRDLKFWFRLQRGRAEILFRFLIRFLTHDLWSLDENIQNLSRWRARGVRDLKVIIVLCLSYSKRKIAFQATALAFRTILALVPLLAVVLFGLSHLGFDGYLEGFILAHVHEQGVMELVLSAARNLIATSMTGLFGVISAVSFLWILIWMMLQVITVFDNVWGNIRQRSMLKNLLLVTALLVLMPFVLLLFIGGFLFIGQVFSFVLPGAGPTVRSLLNWFTLGALTVVILSLMYTYIPSVKVRYRYAFRAAFFSGIIFTLLEYLYFGTQIFLTGQSAVYGYFAAIPLFMVWLNLGWTVILFGAELSYAMQVVQRRDITVRELDDFLARSRREGREHHRDTGTYDNVSDILHDVKHQRN